MANYSLPITKPISPWWASCPIFLQNLPSSARLLPASDVVWRRVAMHNDRLISDEMFPLLASFMLVDMTIAPFCGAGEAYAKLLDWDRPAPNASLFDYDDRVPKQCTIDAGEYEA